MMSFACGFIGKWLWLVFQWIPRKPFHRELQQFSLARTRNVQGIAFSLASLSHVLWEALGERRLFSSGWQQSLRSIHHKHLFSSWIVFRLPVLCGWERAGGGARALLLLHVARICRLLLGGGRGKRPTLRVRHVGTHSAQELADQMGELQLLGNVRAGVYWPHLRCFLITRQYNLCAKVHNFNLLA